ncbi:MAG: asparaginase [Cellvibrionaceae bacterium]|nr:asparaginase [Cellvibrionaceae bacterium]
MANAEPPQKINHFCCGNHLAIKHACVKLGYDPDNYFHESSPIHGRLSALLHEKMHSAASWATGSCGLPTAIVTVDQAIRLWQDLAGQSDKQLDAIKRLWAENATLIGGSNRLDTMIINLETAVEPRFCAER